MKHLTILFALLFTLPTYAQQGLYLDKKYSETLPLPSFDELREQLPQPVYDENPLWVETYWKAWELAFRNFYTPTKANGFVSPYIDAAFNNCIFLWDTSFMTMFCNYVWPLVPGICSLDNFYAKQYPDGEICREISRENGTDCPFWVNTTKEDLYSAWGYNVPDKREKTPVNYVGRETPATPPHHTLDNMNHPIMAWAELVSYRLTGDKARLKMIYEPLKHQYYAFREYSRQGNGLYMTDWASMDNSSRNKYLTGGGTGIDISCEMVLFARNLAEIAALTNHTKDIRNYNADAEALTTAINTQMWSKSDEFYYDLTSDGRQTGIRTIAAYWSLLAGVAGKQQAAALAKELENPETFGRRNLVPTLPADEEGYSADGNYWCGSVWAPTTAMVIDGLQKYGYAELARKIALNHVALVADVYRTTGTIWENYAPDKTAQGRHADGRDVAKDFVGWSGIGPIKFFIDYALGLQADALKNTLTWDLRSDKTVGCRNFRFNNNLVSLKAPEGIRSRELEIEARKPFTLTVKIGGRTRTFKLKKGRQTICLTNQTINR